MIEIKNKERIIELLKQIPEFKGYSFFDGDNPFEFSPSQSGLSVKVIVKIWGKDENQNQVAFQFILYNLNTDIADHLERYIIETHTNKKKEIIYIQPVERERLKMMNFHLYDKDIV